jgi:hypothetical protein
MRPKITSTFEIMPGCRFSNDSFKLKIELRAILAGDGSKFVG